MALGAGFDQDNKGYRENIRARFKQDPEARQHMLIAAYAMNPRHPSPEVKITGPFAEEARRILMDLRIAMTKEEQP